MQDLHKLLVIFIDGLAESPIRYFMATSNNLSLRPWRLCALALKLNVDCMESIEAKITLVPGVGGN